MPGLVPAYRTQRSTGLNDTCNGAMRLAWELVCRPQKVAVLYDFDNSGLSVAPPNERITLLSLYMSPATGKKPLSILPMALVLALHLGLVLLWATHANVPTSRDDGQRYLTLTWLFAPRPRDPAPPVPPPRVAPTRSVRVVAAPTAVVPQAAPSIAAVDLEEAPQRETPPQPATSGALDVNQLMETAKRQAGAIDHDLRAGKLAPLAPDRDLPIARLRGALASAYIDRSRNTVTESMRQADGVIIYRFRRGEKIWCRQSGGVGSSIERSEGAKLAGAGSAGGAGTAGTIPCPGDDAGWSRL